MSINDIDAIAIRYAPRSNGTNELKNASPIAVFADQGLTGAALPGLPAIKNLNAGFLKHELSQICFVTDCSGSMDERLVSGGKTRKLDYVLNKLTQFIENNLPDNIKSSLIIFNDSASLENNLIKSDLQEKIKVLKPLGGTNFSLALEKVKEAFDGDTASRKMVIFITDGHNNQGNSEYKKFAREIRELNAGTVIAGIGADYDLTTLLNLSGDFGFSAWGHAPMPNPQHNIFEALLPDFISNITANDYYLGIEADCHNGRIADAWGLTPSIRPFTMPGEITIGYRQSSLGVFYINESENTEITLKAGEFCADPKAQKINVEIIDAGDAAAHFERLNMGELALTEISLLKAKIKRDIKALESIADKNPSLADEISRYIETLKEDQNDQKTRMASNASIAFTANSLTFFGNDESIMNQTAKLHSGDLGPLDQSLAGSLSSAKDLNPANYQNVIPLNHARLVFYDPATQFKKEVDIQIPIGTSLTIGRSRSCDITIDVSSVSRVHCEISRVSESEFVLSDCGSRNGTRHRGELVYEPVRLEHHDIFTLTDIDFTVILP